jgi:hypothetical protein
LGHPFVFQNTKDPLRILSVLPTGGRTTIPSGHIRQNLSFTNVVFGMPSLILLSSTCEGTSLRYRPLGIQKSSRRSWDWVSWSWGWLVWCRGWSVMSWGWEVRSGRGTVEVRLQKYKY